MKVARYDLRLALALLCALTCLYWLTDGAHTYIADGETVYLVTESLVERGTFAQLEEEEAGDAPRAVVRGRDGRLYAFTAPLQSLLAVPLYLVGKEVAGAFPPPFYAYFTRFFVLLFNAPVAAATVALLYLFGVDLGYRRRTALFVALAYGLTTAAWPYARTFYAESLLALWLVLGAWAAYRYVHTGRWGWMAAVGAAMGLGISSKYVMGVSAPAFVLYLLLGLRHQPAGPARWRWLGRTVLAGGVTFGLIAALLGAFNVARFGSLMETGYTQEGVIDPVSSWGTQVTPLVSWYGYLFSSGKGFFFFSPLTVACLWSLAPLARRRRDETVLFVALVLIYPLFYSLTTMRWHGGGNWGPRYVVCVIPFALLPVGAFLERQDLARWWRVGWVTILFVLGFFVQLSTVFVNYDTYLFSDVSARLQRFHPSYSTLLAQWRLWPRQVRRWRAYDHELRTSGASFALLEGSFHPVEVEEMAPFGRWMGRTGRLRIYAAPNESFTVRVAYSRPRGVGDEAWQGLHFWYDRVPVAAERALVAQEEEATRWVETLRVAAEDVHIYPGTLGITATTWTPTESGDRRDLSVFVEGIEVLSDGAPVPFVEANLPRPLPVTTAYPWSWRAMRWFYDPANARPFDIWPWYVWTSGVPLKRARVFIGVLATLFGGGLAASLVWLIRLLRRW